MDILLVPINGLLEFFSSLHKIQKIYKPTIIKPKLLRVFTGSLKSPPETLSHHLDASPIRFEASVDCINPSALRVKNKNKKLIDTIKAI